MKSFHLILIPIFVAASAQGDVLSSLSPFMGSSRPDYDPASIKPDSAMENPTYAPFSPADSDLGVQQVLGSYNGLPPVKVVFDTSISYTDNAPGAFPFVNDASWYSASRLGVSWLPRIAYGWFADIGISQELYRFEGNNAADFENFRPYIGVVKSIPELDDLVFYTRYEYQRITAGSFSDSKYSAQKLRTGLKKDLLLTSRCQLSAGVDASFDLAANNDLLDHNEYSVDMSYTYWLADRLSSTLSWTGTMWDFSNGGREDLVHTVGLELTWTPCKNARVFTNVFYTNCNSNVAGGANDFEAWQSGIGFGLNYSF
ncbi:MAG: hypothetical protein WCS43_08890 [Verrucomicrobiota bacterium]